MAEDSKQDVEQTLEIEKDQPEKMFTQAELDTILAKRLARVKKEMPSEEELSSFREWQKSHNDTVISNLTNERDSAKNELSTVKAELEAMKREKFLLSKGINADDVDYYAFKIGKNVTDKVTFEQAAEAFLAENNGKSKVTVDLSGNLEGGKKSTNPNDVMNALLRGKK